MWFPWLKLFFVQVDEMIRHSLTLHYFLPYTTLIFWQCIYILSNGRARIGDIYMKTQKIGHDSGFIPYIFYWGLLSASYNTITRLCFSIFHCINTALLMNVFPPIPIGEALKGGSKNVQAVAEKRKKKSTTRAPYKRRQNSWLTLWKEQYLGEF